MVKKHNILLISCCVIVGTICLILAGCSSTKKNNPYNHNYVVEQMAVTNKIGIRVNGVSFSHGNSRNKPINGNKYVIVDVTLLNRTHNNITYHINNFKFKNNNELIIPKIIHLNNIKCFNHITLRPKQNVDVDVVTEIPSSQSKNLQLLYASKLTNNKQLKFTLLHQ